MAKYYAASRYNVTFKESITTKTVRHDLARIYWTIRETTRNRYPKADIMVRNRIVRATMRKYAEYYARMI